MNGALTKPEIARLRSTLILQMQEEKKIAPLFWQTDIAIIQSQRSLARHFTNRKDTENTLEDFFLNYCLL